MPHPHLLDVEITLDERRLWIGFRYPIQAQAYEKAMSHSRNNSIPRIKPGSTTKDSRWVSMSLPQTVTKIVVCGGDEGFYFDFDDRNVPTLWENELLIWKRVGQDGKARLAIDRDMSNARLRDVLKDIPPSSNGAERHKAPEVIYDSHRDPQATHNSYRDPDPTYNSRCDPPETRGGSRAYQKMFRR